MIGHDLSETKRNGN